MAHKVLVTFKEKYDDNRIYEEDSPYPQGDFKPTEERIAELSTEKNEYGYAFIGNPDGEFDATFELEKLSPEAIKEQYTNDEIKARLDELGIEYKSSDNKDKLIERFTTKEAGE